LKINDDPLQGVNEGAMKLTIENVAKAGPIYQQVKEGIEDLIGKDELKSGETMPRPGEVARLNNIPESEVIRAYYELVVSGTLTKIQKKNMFGESMVEHSVK
jgi:DNA-binding transcriptional regulator YhcF (GntR family)